MKLRPSLLITAALSLSLFAPLSASAEEHAQNSAEISSLTLPHVYGFTWQQAAAERKALCYQTYNNATRAMQAKISDKRFKRHRDGRLYSKCEAYGQGRRQLKEKPVAIILDLDETVIDNGAYDSWLLFYPEQFKSNKASVAFFTYQSLSPDNVETMPGAIEFLKQCRSWGITPIYITNRDEKLHRAATLQTLKNLGLDSPTLEDELLCRDKKRDRQLSERIAEENHYDPDSLAAKELLDNASDKASRRKLIEEKYEVIGFFGDDLYDHPVIVSLSAKGEEARAQREEQVRQNARHFGWDWFVLPNSVYGSWLEKSGFKAGHTDEAIKVLRQTAQPFDDWYKENGDKY
ncbi:hypothetical protein IJT17_05840 [bacterium]|nr:hypothetical protein [bacterium]